MIPPYELENKQFKKAVKGYNVADVDEHIDFIIEKYTELYRAYNELERRYAEVSAELEVFRNNEDAIRRALVEAQNTKAKIIRDATRRSEIILKSSKENCDRIIAGFKEQVNQERITLSTLKAQVEEFKYRIFSQYQQHIEYLEQIAPDKDTGAEWNLPAHEYAGKVVAQIVLDVDKAESEAAEGSDADESTVDQTALDTLVNADAEDLEEIIEQPEEEGALEADGLSEKGENIETLSLIPSEGSDVNYEESEEASDVDSDDVLKNVINNPNQDNQ